MKNDANVQWSLFGDGLKSAALRQIVYVAHRRVACGGSAAWDRRRVVESQYANGLSVFRCGLAAGGFHHHEQCRFHRICEPLGAVCGWGGRWAGKSDKGTAGLAALLAFLVMNATINALLILTGKLAQENPGPWGRG